jgi:transcriptional regulator with XRE-family HTH domain
MQIQSDLTDQTILHELGERLASTRIQLNLTQADLAEQAGVAKRTIERLESGQAATQLSGFLRVCRVLGLLERLDTFIPEPAPSPIAQLKHKSRQRQRASGKKAAPRQTRKWSWGEPG